MASITVNGTPDYNTALVIGTSYNVVETAGAAGGWTWTFISVPEGSVLVNLTNPTLQTASFIPDVSGSYVIKCVTDTDGNATGVGSVLTDAYGIRLPGAHETTEFGVDGWAPGLNAGLQALDDGDEQYMHIVASVSGLSTGEMAYLQNSSGGLPQAFLCDGTRPTNYPIRKPAGMAMKNIAASTPGHIMTRGLYTGTFTGGVVGQPVFCADGGAGTLSLTPSVWPVGVLLSTTEAWLNFDTAHQFVYKEKWIPIRDFDDAINPPAGEETIIDGFGVARIRKFSSSTSEDLSIILTIPERVMAKGGVKFQVFGYISNTAPASSLYAMFKAGAYTIGPAEPIDGVYSADVSSRVNLTTAYAQYDSWRTELSALITPTGDLTPVEDLNFMFYRDHDDTYDTYLQDIGVTGVKVFWIERM